MRIKRKYAVVFALALVTSALYCFSLPLWEGFDEAFHYAYVEWLCVDHQIPALGRTPISQEVRTSLNLAPISFILKRNIPGTISFEDWFALSQSERLERLARLRTISAAERYTPSTLLNYEAQQAPLAYIVLMPIDAALGGLSLPARVLILRLICSLAATALLFLAMQWLCRTLGLDEPFQLAALALVFEMQIYEAAIAHVANDWLAISAATWFFAALAGLVRYNRTRDALVLAIVLAVGLLSKAYFLAFVPVFVLVLSSKFLAKQISLRTALLSAAIAVALAGPWYVRNLLVYRTLAGMQENVKGVNQQDVLYAFLHIHWGQSLVSSSHRGLWTGNESYLSFSQGTLNFLLIFLLAGFAMFFWNKGQWRPAERWVLLTNGCFGTALIYDLCVTWSDTHGQQTAIGPYYTPCILPAIFTLTFLGLQRAGTAGRVVAVTISIIALWIALMTYFAKLLPYYGGLIGRSTLPVVLSWWASPKGKQILSATMLGPRSIVYALLICYTGLLIVNNWQILLHLAGTSKFRTAARSPALPGADS